MLRIEQMCFSGGLKKTKRPRCLVKYFSLSQPRLHLLQSAVCLWSSQLDVDTQRGCWERKNKDEMVRAERTVCAGPSLYSSNTSDSLPGNTLKSWTKNTLESDRTRDVYESHYTYSQQGVRVLMSLFYNPHKPEHKNEWCGLSNEITLAHITFPDNNRSERVRAFLFFF